MAWQVGSNGAQKRHWFVWRKGSNAEGSIVPAKTARGNVRWFGSREAALRAAALLNG